MTYAAKTTKRFITLIEIMIVMLLIAMIMGVVAWNYQGTLEEGKAFETKAEIEKIRTILTLEVANNPESMDGIETKWRSYVERSPLVQNAQKLYTDGWGEEYRVSVEQDDMGFPAITVQSKRLEGYQQSKR